MNRLWLVEPRSLAGDELQAVDKGKAGYRTEQDEVQGTLHGQQGRNSVTQLATLLVCSLSRPACLPCPRPQPYTPSQSPIPARSRLAQSCPGERARKEDAEATLYAL